MTALPQPDVILTHESDLDGFVAGHLLQRLARHLFGADVPLEAWNTQAWRQRAARERSAWVTDFAFEARFDRRDWVVIDHHPTEASPAQARLIHDPSRSAAALAYQLACEQGLGSPALDRLVRLTDVGDLFLQDDPEFVLAQDYAGLVKTYQFWNLSRLIDGDLARLVDHPLLQVIAVKRQVEDPLGLAWSRQHVIEITPAVGLVEVVVGNANQIVHQLLLDGATPHAVLLTMMRKANGIVLSLRSRQGEALEVARLLQGGGHPNAAGATLPRSAQHLDTVVEHLRRALNSKPGPPAGLNSLESAFAALAAPPARPS